MLISGTLSPSLLLFFESFLGSQYFYTSTMTKLEHDTFYVHSVCVCGVCRLIFRKKLGSL